MSRVLVLLSGGIDSSMACYLLKNMGFDVIGVTMKIWEGNSRVNIRRSSCCGPDGETLEAIRRFTENLSIPHFFVDVAAEFKELILRDFFAEYSKGRTPNPCIRCNSHIKFGVLLEKIKELGLDFEKVATGHYAKVEYDPEKKRFLLLRGKDKTKDQSYFLYRLTQEKLQKILFPLSDYTKEEVKKLAVKHGFNFLLERGESQDFLPYRYSEIFSEVSKPGHIVDPCGKVIGVHTGICHYTVGQRRGLNLKGLREPYYVLKIDPERNEIVAGPKRLLLSKVLFASNLNWIVPPEEVKGKILYGQIRFKSKPLPCTMELQGERVKVEFLEPQEAITPGQSVVLYDGDVVVGGGIID